MLERGGSRVYSTTLPKHRKRHQWPPRVTIADATTNLSELLRRVESGEDIVIVDGDKPIAVLSAFKADTVHAARRAGLGSLEGAFDIPPDDALIRPLSAAELDDAFGPAGALFK